MPIAGVAFLSAGAAVVLVAGVLAARAILGEGSLDRLESDFARRLRLRMRSPALIPAAQFGNIERDIKDLKEVIIVAHRVENPEETLRAAVQDNFQEGVRYVFLVSQSQFLAAATAYMEFFRAIFTIAKQLAPESGPHSAIRNLEFEQLFSIRALRGEWGSWPYVFYRFNGVNGTPLKMVAFRGDQVREGIAENYIELSGADAQSIFNACEMALSDESKATVAAEPVEFEDASTVTPDSDGKIAILSERRAK